MSEFHFLRPEWLWLLIPWLVCLPWLRTYMHKRANWQHLIASHLSQRLMQGSTSRTSQWPFYALISGLLITIIGLSGPSWQRISVPLFNQDQGAVIVLDASMQTRAQDTNPDRFTRLSFKATDIVNQFNVGQLGFIAYAGDAFTVTPLTRDSATILQSLQVLTPEIMPTPGNDPLLAMQEAARLLSAAGYAEGEIIWLTSGIDQRDMEDLRQFFRTNNYRVSILAAGTEDGAPIRDSEGELLRDNSGRVILARLIPEYLQRISSETGGRYVLATVDGSDVTTIMDFSRQQNDTSESVQQGEQWRDAGPWFVLLLIPLVILAARKGVLWALLLAFLFAPEPVIAQSVADAPDTDKQQRVPGWKLPFSNRAQYAEEQFRAGNYRVAAENYTDPMAQGMAWYRAEDYANAAESFAQVRTPEGDFNLGNALVNLGELESAIAAYENAIAERPDWTEARENLALTKEMLEQQEQENSNESSEDGEPNAEESESGEQDGSENETTDSEQQSNQQENQPDSSDEADADNRGTDEQEGSSAEEREGVLPDTDEALSEEEALAAQLEALSTEEAEELEQLLRKVDDDPAILLRNRLLLEAQRRRLRNPPRSN
ncbi:hypothetical protein CWE13_03790 [Aliidiomarina shirensis]|uniref:VWFA domain-containing protein n=1 Tax=Aliidiomarina shirensis TaxID=1048642 RepID=A0A432WYH2_9GAMM|nr:VWA domain-containing protein [Aliidiomarina shirensis]RUO38767.1 hypothetical protein CWE13_03790 [Aliidiomarina shirensis]